MKHRVVIFFDELPQVTSHGHCHLKLNKLAKSGVPHIAEAHQPSAGNSHPSGTMLENE
jgi:hypothetical protein